MRRFMRGANGFAVGSAIARTIHAAAEHAERETIESWVSFCANAADEARAAVLENPPQVVVSRNNDPNRELLLRMGDALSREDHARYGAAITDNAGEYSRQIKATTRPLDGAELEAAANEAAAMAFRCCMPQLTGRRRAQAYFACVAAGLQRGHFKGAEAKAMLHSAQLALNAFPKRQQKPRTAQRKVGFER